MLLSETPPPLPNMAALCQQRALGFLDPLSMISSVLTPISNFFVAKEQAKTAKKQIALQAKALKDAKDQDTRDFAYAQAESQADALSAPGEAQRKEQLIVLAAVGGAAVLISAMFIMASAKANKE